MGRFMLDFSHKHLHVTEETEFFLLGGRFVAAALCLKGLLLTVPSGPLLGVQMTNHVKYVIVLSPADLAGGSMLEGTKNERSVLRYS
jgi:hypothetical protein